MDLNQLLEQIAQKSEELKRLTEIESPTKEDIDKAVAIDEELKSLEAAAEEARRLEEIRVQNEKRLASLRQPAPTVPQPQPDPAEETKGQEGAWRVVPQHSPVTAFTGATEHERAIKALQFGRWLLGSVWRNPEAAKWCQANGVEIKAQNETSNAAGGFLVPVQFTSDLISLIAQYGEFRTLARRRVMTSDTIVIPRRTTGVSYYWGTEGGSMADSTKTWDRIELRAKKLYAFTKYSSEWSEDAIIDVANDIATEISQAFAEAEDQAGFNGDGTSTYGGIIGLDQAFRKTVTDAGGTWTTDAHKVYNPSIVLASGNAWSEVALADMVNMIGAIGKFRGVQANNVWMCNSAFYGAVMVRLIESAGGATVSEMAARDMEGRPFFLGRPVVFCEVLPAQEGNSTIPCYYGDLSLAATIGDRRQLTIAQSDQFLFDSDQVAIRGTERLDIVVHDVGTAWSSASGRKRGPVAALALQNS